MRPPNIDFSNLIIAEKSGISNKKLWQLYPQAIVPNLLLATYTNNYEAKKTTRTYHKR